MKYIINDFDSASQLKVSANRKAVTEIQVHIDGYSEQTQYDLGRRLTRLNHACGCEMGAIFLGITLILLLVFAVNSGTPILEMLRDYGVTSVALLIGSIFLGKMIGLIFAKIAFKRTLQKIISQASIAHTLSQVIA